MGKVCFGKFDPDKANTRACVPVCAYCTECKNASDGAWWKRYQARSEESRRNHKKPRCFGDFDPKPSLFAVRKCATCQDFGECQLKTGTTPDGNGPEHKHKPKRYLCFGHYGGALVIMGRCEVCDQRAECQSATRGEAIGWPEYRTPGEIGVTTIAGPSDDDYAPLREVLDMAYAQAAEGKGKERHANGKPFIRQPIMEIGRMVGPGYQTGQAMKKCQEAERLPTVERKVAELLGAINYIAAAVILLREAK